MSKNIRIIAILLLTHTALQQTVPLKIGVDLTRLETAKTKVTKGDEVYLNLKNKIIPSVVKYLEETYSVYSDQTLDLTGQSVDCANLKIEDIVGKKLTVNYVIIVDWVDESSSSFAANAGACKASRTDYRPIMGVMNLNLAHLDATDAGDFENAFTVILHEFHHALGFSPVFLDKFYNRDEKKVKAKSEVMSDSKAAPFESQLIMKDVLDHAKEYFSCSTMEGVPLENTGTSATKGAHWDQFVVGNEIMGPSTYPNLVVSKLTLLYFKGTGYYDVKMDMAETLMWGSGVGCDMISGDCTKNPYACTANTKTCSYDYKAMGQCLSDKYAEGCNTFTEVAKGDCRNAANEATMGGGYMKFGPGSRCFLGQIGNDKGEVQTELSPNCLQATCVTEGSATKIKLTVEGKDLTCSTDGEQLDYESGKYIKCPTISRFCKKGMMCTNDCSGNGRCKSDGTCWCYSGFSGSDCSTTASVHAVTYIRANGFLAKILFVLGAGIIFSFL